VVAIVLLQLRHSLAGRASRRPRAWQGTLIVQVLLLVVLVAATRGDQRISGIGMAAFPAGSALLLLTGWWAWLAFTVIAAGVGVHWVLLYPNDSAAAVYIAAVAAATGLAVYGLSRLTDVAEEMETARRNLAYAAVDRERLRVAQDSHDLLGLGLAAVALKCDLAGRLIGRDDARARGELDSLIRLAAQTHSEMQQVSAGAPDLSLAAEVTADRQLLVSAGIDVQVHPADVPGLLVPEQVGAVLATVLREAVTNVLRHARATRCDIDLTPDTDGIELRVTNDGVRESSLDRTRQRGGGRGLPNLTARVAAMGGRLVTRAGENHFDVTAWVPLPADASTRPALRAAKPPGPGLPT
jgi:two-component system sensor histidine kinase DesK